MNNEHTIVKGSYRLDSCASHMVKVLGEDGYRVNVSKIAGGSVTQVSVAKTGLTNKVIAYATLNLWTAGDDLKFKIEKNAAVTDPLSSSLRNPLDMILGGAPVSLMLDIDKQNKLEEKIFLEACLCLTAS